MMPTRRQPLNSPEVLAGPTTATGPASHRAVSLWSSPPVLHPNHYAWFVFLSALDLMLTWVLILQGGSEINPIADAVLQRGGLASLTVFKFAIVMLVIVICEWATRSQPRTGFKLAEWAVAITAVPVAVSFALLWSAR